MSNLDGQDPNFDDLDLLGDEMLAPEEQAVEPAAEPAAEQPPEAEGEPVEIETAEQRELPPEGADDVPVEAAGQGPAEARKLPFPLEWGIGIAIPVVLLVLVLLQAVYLSTAIYLIAAGLVAFGVWRERETSTAYTVLLACALVAILTAVYCLWSELGRYHFDLRAKQRSSLSTPIRAGLLADTGRPASVVSCNCRDL